MRRHQASLRGYLAFLGCPSGLVDDLVQDVFLAALSSGFADYSPRATAVWLRRAAHHLLIKTLERERRAVALSDAASAELAWVEFEGDDGGERYLAALRDCLQRVRGRAREALALRYGEALGRAEIGRRLQLGEEGVKSTLARARQRLRECVEARLGA